MRTRPLKHRARRTALVLALVGLVTTCGDDAPKSVAKVERISIEPDFFKFGKAMPDSTVPYHKRYGSYVLSDDREEHEMQLGVEIVLPLPPGERACETALAAVAPTDTIPHGTPIGIDIWLEEDGARRLVFQKQFDLVTLREHWTPIEFEFGHPVVPGAHLIARASSGNKQHLPAQTRLFLGDPSRSGGGDNRPNLLLISVDTLRADHLHCYKYARDTSPNIDALASRGVLFEQAQSSAPWTMASYGSLFTSRSPTVHRAGVSPRRNSTFLTGGDPDPDASEKNEALAPDLPVLAEVLRDHGWATAGFQWNPYLQGSSGLSRGFQRWVYYKWCADTAVDLALDWIGRRKGAPWFAFVHMVDPHQPYSAPPPFDRKYAGSAMDDVPGYPPTIDVVRAEKPAPSMRQFFVDEYDGEIAWTDAQIGRLLDTLAASGELDNTIILFHADHGEEFWDHDGYEHGHTVYQELLHVPLIVSFPGKIPAGVRVADRVGLIDVMPTVLDLLQVEAPKAIEGISLVPAFQGKKLPAREFLSECLLYGDWEAKALIVGNEKLIMVAGEDPMLFDLAKDPHELDDLAPTETARAHELRDKLMRRAQTLAAQAHASSAREISEQEQADLHGLGYGEGRKSAGDPGDKHPPTDEELTTWFGVVPDAHFDKKGIQVESTTPGGPAEQAGILKGDVLVRMDSTKLLTVHRFLSTLRMRRSAGEVVRVKFVRAGQEQETHVTLPDRDQK